MSDKTVTKDGVKVEEGQRWRALNKRVVEIIEVNEDAGAAYYRTTRHGRRLVGRLSIGRMHNTGDGWELVP